MITGTFLDEITHLPSANWGREEWRRDFASMKADGIDTVILTRVGLRDRAAYDSDVLRRVHPHLLVQDDLVALFLALAREHDMSLWLGAYDSDEHWAAGRHQRELDLSRAVFDEIWERYGRASAFRGWHLGHPIDPLDDGALRATTELARHLRQLSALPVAIAPRLCGIESAPEPFTPERHRADWVRSYTALRGHVDIVAFQAGGLPYPRYEAALALHSELASAGGFQSWCVAESFEREAPATYLPIAWPKLRYQMQSALAARAGKLITFEYSRYLSPNSIHPSAHGLHRRYREWLATQS